MLSFFPIEFNMSGHSNFCNKVPRYYPETPPLSCKVVILLTNFKSPDKVRSWVGDRREVHVRTKGRYSGTSSLGHLLLMKDEW